MIAVLLDIKLGEFGIHANVIDHFIKRHFRESAVTVIPTCIIALLAALAFKTIPVFSGQSYTMPIAYGFCGIYVTAGFASVILFRR